MNKYLKRRYCFVCRKYIDEFPVNGNYEENICSPECQRAKYLGNLLFKLNETLIRLESSLGDIHNKI